MKLRSEEHKLAKSDSVPKVAALKEVGREELAQVQGGRGKGSGRGKGAYRDRSFSR